MDADVSSYPRAAPVQQQNPLDTIAKVQGIQRNNLAINKDKLDLYNQKYDIINRGLGNLLAVPEGELTANHFYKFAQNMVNQGAMTPEDLAGFVTPLPVRVTYDKKYPNVSSQERDKMYEGDLRKIAATHMLQAQEKNEAIKYFAAQSAQQDTGANIVSGNQGRVQATRGGLTPPSPFEQGSYTGKQLPVEQTGPPAEPPVTIPVGRSQPRLPVQAPLQGVNGPGEPRVGEPGNAAERVAQGRNTINNKPLLQEGRAAITEDQLRAKGLSSQNVIALKAYKAIQGLRSGPTTGPWNEAVAALKANNIIQTTENDPTAIYQEANKYLNQIIQAGGTRSDAALAQSEASSPSAKIQINPALVKLTRSLIGQNRTEITLPNEFQGSNLSDYGAHRSTYASKVDQTAATYDLLPKEEKAKIWKEMKAKKDTTQGKRFFDTLRIMRKHGQFDSESLSQ